MDVSTEHLDALANRACLAAAGSTIHVGSDCDLPVMPAIAVRAREIIDRDDRDVDTIAHLLLKDPAMAAKLIQAANSAVFYGGRGITTCEQAIVRLGLSTVRYLIVSFALRRLFDGHVMSPGGLAHELWEHSTEVAAIASVLARHTRSFPPGEAQLAGLLHDVGVIAVLDAAARDPGLQPDLETVVALVASRRAEMSTRVLRTWHFPESLVRAAGEAEDWHRDPAPEADLADLVVVAQLLSFIDKRRIATVPAVVSVPALGKLLGEDTSRAQIEAFLDEARERIEEVRSLLRN